MATDRLERLTERMTMGRTERWVRASAPWLSVATMLGSIVLLALVGTSLQWSPRQMLVPMLAACAASLFPLLLSTLWALRRQQRARSEASLPSSEPRWRQAVPLLFIPVVIFATGLPWPATLAAGVVCWVSLSLWVWLLRRREPEPPRTWWLMPAVVGPLILWLPIGGLEIDAAFFVALSPTVVAGLWSTVQQRRAQADPDRVDGLLTSPLGQWIPPHRKLALRVRAEQLDAVEALADYLDATGVDNKPMIVVAGGSSRQPGTRGISGYVNVPWVARDGPPEATRTAWDLRRGHLAQRAIPAQAAAGAWGKAEVARARGELEAAETWAERAVLLSPDLAGAWLCLAELAVQREAPDAPGLVQLALRSSFRALDTTERPEALRSWLGARGHAPGGLT